MINSVWGKKIGMTQVFSGSNVVPVTVVDTAHWFVTAVKNQERDGYDAVQVGLVRKRYEGQSFSAQWLKKPKNHFMFLREIRLKNPVEGITVGQEADFEKYLAQGSLVDVVGTTKGHGFQGVMKRHGFAGGPASHGSMFHRRPGTMSFMRSRGRVIKGKRLPGHMGVDRCMAQHLEVVQVIPEKRLVLVKGSVPGKKGSLLYLKAA